MKEEKFVPVPPLYSVSPGYQRKIRCTTPLSSVACFEEERISSRHKLAMLNQMQAEFSLTTSFGSLTLALRIIVALLTAFEGVGSVLVSWLPMYDEFKLAFFVYLWHPKTKGASYVYDTILLPYIISHEWDIDHNVLELKTKAGHFAVLYLNTVANYGQEKFFELLQFFSSRSPKLKSDQVPEAPVNGGRHSSQSPPQTRGTPSVPQASSHEHGFVPSAPPVPREYEFDDRANEAANWRPPANGRNHGQADSFLPGTAQGGRDGLDMERMIHNAHMRLRRDRR